mmetsp:Transcript_82330/g.209247  ORF Transcript_82330/g.209247 Transcript_82330/m.209247 type:complete len:278 (-) Transcript_82330:117-950(-)
MLAPMHAKRDFQNGRVREVADKGSSLGGADEQVELQDHSFARAVQFQPQESVAPTPLLARRPPPADRLQAGGPILTRHKVQPDVVAAAEAHGRRYQGAIAIFLELPENVLDEPLRTLRLCGGARWSSPCTRGRHSCELRRGRGQARRRPAAFRKEDARRRCQRRRQRRRRKEARRRCQRRECRQRCATRGARAGRERSAGAGCLHTARIDANGVIRGCLLEALGELALQLAEGDQPPLLQLGRPLLLVRRRHHNFDGLTGRTPPSVRTHEAQRHGGQ